LQLRWFSKRRGQESGMDTYTSSSTRER